MSIAIAGLALIFSVLLKVLFIISFINNSLFFLE